AQGQAEGEVEQARQQQQAAEAVVPPAVEDEAGQYEQAVLPGPARQQPVEREHDGQEGDERRRGEHHALPPSTAPTEARGDSCWGRPCQGRVSRLLADG